MTPAVGGGGLAPPAANGDSTMVDTRRVVNGTRVAAAALAAAALGAAGGCTSSGERPMTAAMFVPPAAPAVVAVAVAGGPTDALAVQPARSVVPPDDGGGEGPPSPKRAAAGLPPAFDAVPALAPLRPTTAPTASPAGAPDASPAASPTTAPAADAAAAASTAGPATAPADGTAGAGASGPGTYMTVGGVLAEVNGTPIYAHRVLALLDKELAARARDLDADQFKRFAAERIVRQTDELIRDEMDFSRAFKALSPDDQKLAKLIADDDRDQKVKAAGGALELARRRAAEEGVDFEEQLRQGYRQVVVQLWNQREIDPLVRVSAQDLREFYAANADKLYGDKSWLRFRVIEVDPALAAGPVDPHPRETAVARITAVRQHALAPGADFAALARADNDDPGLKKSGGDLGGNIEKGSYRVEAVEQALWQLQPGQVTDVVEADGVLYLAELEEKHDGRTKPFDDPAVQEDVTRRLKQQQVSALWTQGRNAAESQAVVSAPDDRLGIALEMVMQKYARWTGK